MCKTARRAQTNSNYLRLSSNKNTGRKSSSHAQTNSNDDRNMSARRAQQNYVTNTVRGLKSLRRSDSKSNISNRRPKRLKVDNGHDGVYSDDNDDNILDQIHDLYQELSSGSDNEPLLQRSVKTSSEPVVIVIDDSGSEKEKNAIEHSSSSRGKEEYIDTSKKGHRRNCRRTSEVVRLTTKNSNIMRDSTEPSTSNKNQRKSYPFSSSNVSNQENSNKNLNKNKFSQDVIIIDDIEDINEERNDTSRKKEDKRIPIDINYLNSINLFLNGKENLRAEKLSEDERSQCHFISTTRNQILVRSSISVFELHGVDIQCLMNSRAWLNDEIVNGIVHLINAQNRFLLSQRESNCPRAFVLNSHMYTKMAQGPNGFSFNSVRAWSKRYDVSIPDLDLILFPINLLNTHWVLGCIDVKRKKIFYFDSLHGKDRTKVVVNLKKWLLLETLSLSGSDEIFGTNTITQWTDIY